MQPLPIGNCTPFISAPISGAFPSLSHPTCHRPTDPRPSRVLCNPPTTPDCSITQTPMNATSCLYVAGTPLQSTLLVGRQCEVLDLNDRRNTGQRARRDHRLSPIEVIDKPILPALTHKYQGDRGKRDLVSVFLSVLYFQ